MRCAISEIEIIYTTFTYLVNYDLSNLPYLTITFNKMATGEKKKNSLRNVKIRTIPFLKK